MCLYNQKGQGSFKAASQKRYYILTGELPCVTWNKIFFSPKAGSPESGLLHQPIRPSIRPSVRPSLHPIQPSIPTGCTFCFCGWEPRRGDADHVRQRSSRLCSALSWATLNSEMLLQFFFILHQSARSATVIHCGGAKAEVPSRVS